MFADQLQFCHNIQTEFSFLLQLFSLVFDGVVPRFLTLMVPTSDDVPNGRVLQNLLAIKSLLCKVTRYPNTPFDVLLDRYLSPHWHWSLDTLGLVKKGDKGNRDSLYSKRRNARNSLRDPALDRLVPYQSDRACGGSGSIQIYLV